MSEETEMKIKVSHGVEYGFWGNNTIEMVLEEETDDELRGKLLSGRDVTNKAVVVNKNNVAAWAEI